MQRVGPGTVLGGRYALSHRLSQGRGLERWAARDATLERDVTVLVVRSDNPSSAGVLDAARRAAGVEDARLVRILDVGTQHDTSFIVEEATSGAESLAALLVQGPLPAEEARRIAGETARGLAAAGQRGLHHLRLTPSSVMVAPDGSIRVTGVAVAAAVDGPGDQAPDAATASRRDAVCLVAVVYAALTGRWPLDEKVAGLEPAPRVADGAVAPSEIATGVPADLDALCQMTLLEASGPLTPGDFANRIAPWPRERVRRTAVDPTVLLQVPSADDPPALADRTEQTLTETVTAAGAATSKAFGSALAGAGAAAGAVTGKLSAFAHAAGEMGTRSGSTEDTQRMRSATGLSAQIESGGLPPVPPLPLLPASTALPPSRGQSKIVMLIVTIFVALALIVGFRGLLGIGLSSAGKPTATRTVTATAPAVTVPASPPPRAAATPAGPIAILSASGFDPQGDNAEDNSQAPRVYDGNLATTWSSEGYRTAHFGNLKQGVGVLLDLGQPTSVHQVTIDLGHGPVDLTVYAAADRSLQGATVIGTATAADGRIQVKAATAMPRAQYVIVWFTTLAPDGGQFRASISEIALS